MNATAIPEWSQLIRALREQLGESQEQFGIRFGVTKMTISYWERGEFEPSHDAIRTLLTIDGGRQVVGALYGGL